MPNLYLLGGMALIIVVMAAAGYFYVSRLQSERDQLMKDKISLSVQVGTLEGEKKALEANHKMALEQVANIAAKDALLKNRISELEGSILNPETQKQQAIIRVNSPAEFVNNTNKQLECLRVNINKTDGVCIGGEFRVTTPTVAPPVNQIKPGPFKK